MRGRADGLPAPMDEMARAASFKLCLHLGHNALLLGHEAAVLHLQGLQQLRRVARQGL
jgi:hypothetical protein